MKIKPLLRFVAITHASPDPSHWYQAHYDLVGDISVDNGVLTFVGIENGFAFKDMVPQSLDPEPPKRITTNLPFIVVEELP